MSINPSYEFERVDLGAIDFSKSIAQNERRKHFDQAALADLTENIRVSGVMQPIVVRTNGKPGRFEVVAGERRVIAARKAGHELIPAIVRNLTDDEAVDLQLVENLQREGLHELVEAEGYEDLRKRGYSIEQIADKLGKSTSYVYKRLELSRCSNAVRKAFYNGEIDASKALLVSRLRSDDLQEKALKEIGANKWRDALSFREARSVIQRTFMLRLDQAPFKTEDAALVPAAGPCGKCPKNTVQQAGLFGDVSKEALCTDGECFQSKTAAAAARIISAAKDAGHAVLEGKKAEAALQYSSNYAKLDQPFTDDFKRRPLKQLVGNKAPITVAVDPNTGRAVELIEKTEAKKIIKDRGIKLRASSSPAPSSAPRKQTAKEIEAQQKREQEEKLLIAVARAIHAKAPKPLTLEELQKVVEAFHENFYGGDCFDEITGQRTGHPNFDKLNEAGLIRIVRANLLSENIVDGDKGIVFAAAKRHGVDVKKIEADLAPKKEPAAAAPAAKVKKAAKKK